MLPAKMKSRFFCTHFNPIEQQQPQQQRRETYARRRRGGYIK